MIFSALNFDGAEGGVENPILGAQQRFLHKNIMFDHYYCMNSVMQGKFKTLKKIHGNFLYFWLNQRTTGPVSLT